MIRSHFTVRMIGLMLGLVAALVWGVPGAAVGADKAEPAVLSQYPCPIDADIWLLGGQSNMAGAAPVKEHEAPDDPNIMAFDMANSWGVARDPLHRLYEAAAPVHRELLMKTHSRNAATPEAAEKSFNQFRDAMRKKPLGVGPGLAFAQAVRKETGRAIGLIPCAHGGSSMRGWDPAQSDKGDHSLYGAMLNRVKMIGGGKKIKGLLWYQGESDIAPAPSTGYETNMLNFIDSVRRDLEQPDLPVIYVQIGRYVCSKNLAGGYENTRELQRRLIRLRPNIYFTTAIDQPYYDPIHLSAVAQQCLGRRLAELALTYVYKIPGHGRQLDVESVTMVNGTTIRVKFSGVTGKLQAAGRPMQFELRGLPPADEKKDEPRVFRVEFDPDEPSALILTVSPVLPGPARLVCGPGLDPYMNITDSLGMPIPAFGPFDMASGQK